MQNKKTFPRETSSSFCKRSIISHTGGSGLKKVSFERIPEPEEACLATAVPNAYKGEEVKRGGWKNQNT